MDWSLLRIGFPARRKCQLPKWWLEARWAGGNQGVPFPPSQAKPITYVWPKGLLLPKWPWVPIPRPTVQISTRFSGERQNTNNLDSQVAVFSLTVAGFWGKVHGKKRSQLAIQETAKGLPGGREKKTKNKKNARDPFREKWAPGGLWALL